MTIKLIFRKVTLDRARRLQPFTRLFGADAEPGHWPRQIDPIILPTLASSPSMQGCTEERPFVRLAGC